eukprot:Lithocolla_globosa_v1_NODE_2866_length_1842_cov_4.124790.p1 type:complete len:244 gc:universal NODE_2866_length_1842_cov_4.124790:1641-910(-)
MTLRLNLHQEFAGDLFDLHQTSVSRIFNTMLCLLYRTFKQLPWFPTRELVDEEMPEQFRRRYPKCRVIIDGAEFFITQPHQTKRQKQTYSQYKHDNTFKALIGVSPTGHLCFCSELFTGNTSDPDLCSLSGFYDCLQKGDHVLADKGFIIRDMLLDIGCDLTTPAFLRSRGQFSIFEVTEIRRVANLRIHVERAIGRMKNYTYLGFMQGHLTAKCTMAVYVCAMLTNFGGKLCVDDFALPEEL